MDHLENLNDQQKEAVLHTDGPLLVLAGAGSGKTRVITHRILRLIEDGVAPQNILAVTFTNKAAREMRERVGHLIRKHPLAERATQRDTRQVVSDPPTVGSHAHNDSFHALHGTRRNTKQFVFLPIISTFHSLGVRMLRAHHNAFGLRRHFIIYDKSDARRAIKKALEQSGYSPKQFEPGRILSIISRAKGEGLTRSTFVETADTHLKQVAGEVWEHYDHILKEAHALDFDDLLLKTLILLQNNRPVLKEYREQFQYLHIDEYQDTNAVQYEIARLLAGDAQNICVVGDVDQNIYSWRGATLDNILQFEHHFKGARVILLEENYRSTQTIIGASNNIIEKNKARVPKTVFTHNSVGEPVALYGAYNETDEAHFVATTAHKLIEDGTDASHIAVLFRTNFQSRVLEEAFLTLGIPYQVLGVRFFERKEIKDVLSFLRLAVSPESTADLARVINVPSRGIGKITLLKIVEGKRDLLTGAIQKKVALFETMMADIRDTIKKKQLSRVLTHIIRKTGLEETLKKGGEEELERLENLQELVTLATRYDTYETKEAIERLLEDAALQSDQDELKNKSEDTHAVKLMTIHAAKGLEFPYVFITGLEEGLFPHEKLNEEHTDEEEERRLFYVALTRARKKVFLTFTTTRTIFGSKRINIPSSFLSDIDDTYLEGVEAKEHEAVIEIE